MIQKKNQLDIEIPAIFMFFCCCESAPILPSAVTSISVININYPSQAVGNFRKKAGSETTV